MTTRRTPPENTSAEIRPPQTHELEDVLALIRQKAVFDGAQEALKLDAEMLREALFSATPPMRALVAVIDGAIVGLATYYDIYSSFLGKPGLWLDDLFIAEGYRKRGLGKALLAALCAHAHACGCARVDWLVAADNHAGRGFYEALGATIFDTVKHARLGAPEIARLAARG